MIILSDKQPFAQGGNRYVFVHPQDSNKCIKILQPHRLSKFVRPYYKFPRNLRGLNHYDDNLREQKGYRYVDSIPQQHDAYKHIPHYYGLVKTDIGYGSVSQLMRDYDGNISKTLRQYLQGFVAGTEDKTYIDHVNELKSFIREISFISKKLTPQNILSVRINEHQRRLYIIEGFGTQEWIPLVRYVPFLKKRKIERTLHAFDKRIDVEFSLIKNTVILSANDYFAAGRTRRCYVSPQNPSQCLKIVIPGSDGLKLRNKKYRRLFPASRYNPNMIEWRCYQKVEKMNDETLWQHIPRCYSFVNTNIGQALVLELLCHADGSISTPLIQRIQQGVDESLLSAYNEFLDFIRRSGFYTTEVNNINCVRLPDGSERLYFVECRYRRPGLTFIPAIRRRRLERIIQTRIYPAFNKYAKQK